MSTVIPFPTRDLSAEQQYENYCRELERAMHRHWRAGLRGDAFHAAVRAEFPEADLSTYNYVADIVWGQIGGAA